MPLLYVECTPERWETAVLFNTVICSMGRDQKVEGRCRSTDRPAQQPPLMNFHLLIGDASSPTFAPVKTEIKMYLSLIKRIHVPRFAL